MQRLLTEEEYAQLVPLVDLEKQKSATEATLDLLIGDKCVAKRKNPNRWSSCGGCPVSHVGGQPGEDRPSRELSRAMCPRTRHYSK